MCNRKYKDDQVYFLHANYFDLLKKNYSFALNFGFRFQSGIKRETSEILVQSQLL